MTTSIEEGSIIQFSIVPSDNNEGQLEVVPTQGDNTATTTTNTSVPENPTTATAAAATTITAAAAAAATTTTTTTTKPDGTLSSPLKPEKNNKLDVQHLEDGSPPKQEQGVKLRESYLACVDDNDESPLDQEGVKKPRTSYLPCLDNDEHDDKYPLAEVDHQLQSQNSLAITNQESLGIMDVVRKRAIMANEEIGLNNREVQAPHKPFPRHETMPTETGAFAGAPGEALRRRDDIRFSLVGINPAGEKNTNDDTALGGVDDGALDPIEPALQMSIMEGINSATEATGDCLAEAMPVEDDELPDMEAMPYDVEAFTKRNLKQAKERKKRFLVLGLVVSCLVAGASTGAVYHRKKKEGKDLSPTVAPSLAPTNFPSSAPSGALDFLREGLPEYTRASLEIFNSPQWKAMEWLSRHPELPGMKESRKRQLFVLATFYYSMDGDNWFKPVRDRWMQYSGELSDECLWHSTEYGYFYNNWGVYEYRQWERGFAGVPPCNQDGEFQNIAPQTRESFLAPALHNPSIPAEIALLTSLSSVGLTSNLLNVAINDFLPSQFYHMTNMTLLWLDGNLLTDEIPSELGLMTNMESLHFHLNILTGPIPSQLGLITGMVNLELFSNRFTGEIPTELGLMTNLKKLVLYVNTLTGPIPSELAKMSNMWSLHLSDNNLTGTVPQELEALVMNGSLRSLSLHNNSLSGTIPEGLCSLGAWDDRQSPIWSDVFPERFRLGLSFDCNERLCGCCWCPCPGSNYSNTDKCETDQDKKFREDKDWPGEFPAPSKDIKSVSVNIRSDAFPIQTTFDWSVLDEVSGSWNVTHSEGLPVEGKEKVHSYTMPISSDALYRLQLHDDWGDGTCCWFGLGWFTITSSNPSQDYANGTIVWDTTGFDLQWLLVVFIWVDSNGIAHQVEYVPGKGYALIQDDGSTPSEQDHPMIVVLPEVAMNNGTSIADDAG